MDRIERSAAVEAYEARKYAGSAEVIAAINAIPPARFTREDVEKAAIAICAARSGSPDCLYQHHEWETWPVDNRHEYKDAFTGEARVTLSHFAWRHWADAATAALSAIGDVEHG